MNIIFVSYGGLTSQSTYHVINMAERLESLGNSCVICVPALAANSVEELCTTTLTILSYDDFKKKGYSFPNGKGPDLIHCWTPRETPREFTEYLSRKYSCPYFVHLEDNEREIIHRSLGGKITYEELVQLTAKEQEQLIPDSQIMINPERHWEFLKKARGCTILMDKLAEHVPQDVPMRLFWPGYDQGFVAGCNKTREELRNNYGIPTDAFVILYSGNFSWVMEKEFRQMMGVLSLLKRRGMPLYFLKTGWNGLPNLLEKGIEEGWIKDMGFIHRDEMPDVYSASDILVQPGNGDPFNDYRFPSKLPEAMIAGLPMILPYSNLGRVLKDGEEALITHTGGMEELRGKIVSLYFNKDLREKLSHNARRFAEEKLNWLVTAKNVEDFYRKCISPEGNREERQTKKTNNLYRSTPIQRSCASAAQLDLPMQMDEYSVFLEGWVDALLQQSRGAECKCQPIPAHQGDVAQRIENLERKYRKIRRRNRRFLVFLLVFICIIASVLACMIAWR